MSGWKKFIKFIRHPGVWLWAFYAALAACAAACTIIAVLWNGENAVAYCLYALTLALFIYCLCHSVKPVRSFVVRKLNSNRFTSKMLEDYGYRTVMFSVASFIINAAYAVFQAALSIAMHSLWYGLFAVYYMLLTLMRGAVVRGARNNDRADPDAALRGRLKLYMGCGIFFIILSTVFASLASMLIVSEHPVNYGMYGAIVMAAYTFYKIIVSAINAVKVKKYCDYRLQSLRNINFADALVSVFALQITMVATFGEDEMASMKPLNIFTGAAVFMLTLGLGIYMIVRAACKLKRQPPQGEQKRPEDGRE